MNNNFKKNYFIILLIANPIYCAIPYIPFRSQSSDTARLLVDDVQHILFQTQDLETTRCLIRESERTKKNIQRHDSDLILFPSTIETTNGTFFTTLEYKQSFNPHRLTDAYFGLSNETNNCQVIGISGSQVTDRSSTDWLADYFGLSPLYQGSFTIKPQVKTTIVDFGFYIGLDNWLKGLYCKVHVPLVHVSNHLHFCDNVINFGSAPYPPGYFSSTQNPYLFYSFENFIVNAQTPVLDGTVKFDPLAAALFAPAGKSKTGISEVTVELGWNPILEQKKHIGAGLYVTAPTGKRPQGTYLFEPMIGNGKHWQVGGAFSGHYTFWNSCNKEKLCGIYFEGQLTTMIKGREIRTFDLIGKPISRYMLAQKILAPAVNLQGATYQFDNELTSVANLTTQAVHVSRSIIADISALINYSTYKWSFDIGYNFWAASREKIHQTGTVLDNLIPDNMWALKGNAAVYGFDSISPFNPIALSATQSAATINNGTNAQTSLYLNNAIDNSVAATDNTINHNEITVQPGVLVQQFTSIPPVFLSQCDIDFAGAQTEGISHTVFGNLMYTFTNHIDWKWVPYFGVGATVEFAQTTKNFTPQETSSALCNQKAPHCGLTQWAVWIKGGVSFY